MKPKRPSKTTKNVDTLYFDGLNLCFRMIFSGSKLSSEGKDTSVIYGGVKSIKALVEIHKPNRVVFALEGKNSRAKRKAIYPEYKAKRKGNLPIPKEDFYSQVNDLEDLLYNLGVTTVKVAEFEADDVIAVLATANEKTSLIISTDGDYLQLINDKISVYNPTKEILIHKKNFKEVVGVELIDFLDWKCMIGDKSDNIKGVVGVGEVIATEICNFMGYRLALEAGEENVDKKWKKIFTPEAKEQFELADRLINLGRTELSLEETLDNLVDGAYDADEVKDLLEDVEAWTLVKGYSFIEKAFKGLDNY